MYQAGVFREPAKPGIFGGYALDYGSSVHVGASLEGLREMPAHAVDDGVQLSAQHFVIVIAPGVAGNPSPGGFTGVIAGFPRAREAAESPG